MPYLHCSGERWPQRSLNISNYRRIKADPRLQLRLPLEVETRIAPMRRDAIASLLSVNRPKAACLFSSAGIGELGIERCGIEIACANEIVPYRAALYRRNFPNHDLIEGDIWGVQDEVVDRTREKLDGEDLFLLYATPPCQGMSSNGMGRLKWEVSQGRRHEEDVRNRLIIPTIDIALKLKPRWLLLENVPGMRYTNIRDNSGSFTNIITYIAQALGEEYAGKAEVVKCEDFGIPQKRRRLVTIFTRDPAGKAFFYNNGESFFHPSMKEPQKTLRDAVAHLPRLDAKSGEHQRLDFHPYHYVNVMDSRKYWWIENTPEGDTAFNNQCVNPACGFRDNRRQKDAQIDGKWTSDKNTPIYCARCGHLLPRPTVQGADGSMRLLKGFHSAYRRMKWDEPARALTQNFIYEASDNKVHPEQNRVLSVLEALIVQSVDRYEYHFDLGNESIGTARIAEILGESVPPYLIEKICQTMIAISFGAQRIHPAEAVGLESIFNETSA